MQDNNSRFTSKRYAHYRELSEQEIIEKEALVSSDQLYRPKVHLCPPFGLLNDPNGLAYFNGYYYIFYQWHPNDVVHGLKNWGLYKTKDFVHYEDKGLFLAPHHQGDNFGIYSGGACVIEQQLHLFYTGNHRDEANDYQRKPVQWHVIVDKEDRIISRKVIIDYQQEYTEHQRDPYPFVASGDIKLLLGAQNLAGQGRILVYTLNDSINDVKHMRELIVPKELSKAFMLECPALVSLGEVNILVVSPQGLKAKDAYRYHNIYSVVYMASLSLDFGSSIVEQLDFGFDFYAPQIFKDDKRTLMISWLGQAETLYPHEQDYGWSQVLSVARELSWQQGRLHQQPVRELLSLRGQPQAWDGLRWLLHSRSLDVELVVEESFELRIGNDQYAVIVGAKHGEYYVGRQSMQAMVNEQYGTYRAAPWVNKEQKQLRIIIDHSVMEVFFEGGYCVMSLRFFIDNLAYIKGRGVVTGTLYPLKQITINKLRRQSC